MNTRLPAKMCRQFFVSICYSNIPKYLLINKPHESHFEEITTVFYAVRIRIYYIFISVI